MRRREFIAGSVGAALLAACASSDRPPLPGGSLSGANDALGHRLRQRDFPAPGETRRTTIAIVGGGIGGLSAGWKLARSGCDDFVLLELETEAGGNSRGGRNEVSPYPLGAHYLPLPPREARATRELLAELGVLHGDPHALHPGYDEKYLCHAPQERLYINGYWQEGVWPTHGIPKGERDQTARFQEQLAHLRQQKDSSGRRAFALPLSLSSPNPQLRALDKLSLGDWLRQQDYTAASLHWMTDYACRDDYGTGADQTSAWAGLHYFACRDGDAHGESKVLTAPDGNAWLARGLAAASSDQTQTNALVFKIEERKDDVVCDVFLVAENRSIRLIARKLIWAAPLFLLPHVMESPPSDWLTAIKQIDYAPWVVANLTLSSPPQTRTGHPLAWDNVLYDSPALGYVVATHQAMRYAPGPTVITWYRALHEAAADGRTKTAQRQQMQAKSHVAWAEEVLADLSRPHPEMRELVTRIDIQRYGHAMARPLPGRLWGGSRIPFEQGSPRIRFAHADVSGLSLFEEANYRGVKAAQDTMTALGLNYARSV